MSQRILIDTDVLIDVSRGIEGTIALLDNTAAIASLAVSVITQMELMVGCRNKSEQQILERFLRRFEVIHINESISTQAVKLLLQYRLSHGLLIPDALIAATALVTGYPLLSKNQSDYRFIQDINLLPFNP
ncbi:type II toxin-antitoxin system VapC family toxin [Phormidium sp. LEGE 05292]|uniref:type II toxin-antitoxin system VapC family toxin n=1 Tax=[Phormidium] sp. LEGE 05292 TaxID=767427 RepID=UPI0018817CA3|nr:type II toxin-antitoxin system VapC family toxin [Phormidium sp. LEGE 05292]MBE9225006.1 type II toxin-antitoxin system VapC family toxin [Phormidium sp. LEGE 05292]